MLLLFIIIIFYYYYYLCCSVVAVYPQFGLNIFLVEKFLKKSLNVPRDSPNIPYIKMYLSISKKYQSIKKVSSISKILNKYITMISIMIITENFQSGPLQASVR